MSITSAKVCALCGASHDHQDDSWWANHRENECVGRDGPTLVARCDIAPLSLVKKALQYHNANKRKPRYNGNWLRVLKALAGIEDPPDIPPYTAAEAREAEKIWHGWCEFREALEEIERKGAEGNWRVLAVRPDLEPADYDPNKPPEADIGDIPDVPDVSDVSGDIGDVSANIGDISDISDVSESAADDEEPDWERIKLHEALREAGPESWVVASEKDLPSWYWRLDVWPMNTGNAFGKVQIAPGHFVFWDGSGPRGRWSVEEESAPMGPSDDDTTKLTVPNVDVELADAIAAGDWAAVITMAQEKLDDGLDSLLSFGELEWRDDLLVLPVIIEGYPPDRDELIGRAWISKDSHVSMSAQEAKEVRQRYVETVTDASALTFIVPRSYGVTKNPDLRCTFYFRKSGERTKIRMIERTFKMPKRK